MKKRAVVAVTSSLIASAFVAGVAVGKAAAPTPKFTAAEEVKWDDINGLKLGTLFGDYNKGPYGGLLKIPAGFTSPLHWHSGTYEAVQISGTSSHWLRTEDGTKAKKMTPGSYWTIPGKLEHVSSCAAGRECVMFVWQKTKFDATLSKDDKGTTAGSGALVGSAAKPGSGATSGSAAKVAPAASPKAGAGTGPGSTAPKAGTGSTTPKAGAGTGPALKAGAGTGPGSTAPKAGTGTGSGSAAPKK